MSMVLMVKCKRCGFSAPFKELYLIGLLELLGGSVDNKLKYCYGEPEEGTHDFEYYEREDS